MADGYISQITLPNSSAYDIKAKSLSARTASNVLTGSGTVASYTNSKYYPAKWTFNTGANPNDGDIITIKIPVAGHDYGVFLSTDNGTTYYPIVCNGTGRLTTHYPVNTYLTLIYESAGSAASMFAVEGQTSSTRVTITGGAWRVINYYDSNSNDTGYYHRRIYPNLKAGGPIHPYSIIMQLPNGRWSGITTTPPTNPSTGTISPVGTGKTASSSGYLLGHVLVMYARATYTDGNNIATYNIWSAHTGLIDARYSFNLENTSGNGFTGYAPVYIVGTVNNGLFTLDSTKWWTQTLPSSEDNKVYIYIGDAYDWYRLTFTEDKPIYWYKDGGIRLYTDDIHVRKTGDIMSGGLEIRGHIAGDSGTTGHGLYSGGVYHKAYNNILLHGDATTGTSGIAFLSDKVNANGTITTINQPSDRAFIQYHAYGVTTATAEGTDPTIATTGEAGVLVIGVGNDAGDKIKLQAPGHLDIMHQIGANAYVIPDTGNTTGNVGSTTKTIYVDAGVIKEGTTLGTAATHAHEDYALSGHIHGNITNGGLLATAHRLVWTDGDKKIYAGYHYTNSTKLAINSTDEPSYNLYVNGTSKFTNILNLYRESDTSTNAPAGILFSVRDTTKATTVETASIKVYHDHTTTYNVNLVISSGGGTFVGAGESAASVYSALGPTTSTENLYLTADSTIYAEAYSDTAANRIGFSVNTSGHIIPVKAESSNDNKQNLGASNARWAAVYATDFYGSATNLTVGTAAKKKLVIVGTDNKITTGAEIGTGTTTWLNNSGAWSTPTAAQVGAAASSHTHPVSQLTWAGGVNLTTSATANNQEWSIDLTPGSYTGTYWHVWSAKNSTSILRCYPDNNRVDVPNGTFGVGSANFTYNTTNGCLEIVV